MKKYSKIIAIFIITVIWGYFTDLKNGEIGWFIGRIIFMPILYLFFSKSLTKKQIQNSGYK
ncbi:hypothetical protein BD780_001095 [Clostridium tetanomorphum]|uniref:Uncharacterized protein n=1 Tax=Clostridium tetanomorphum TaxID=1553 RepID=A0A923ECW0_CLOTT|nr:hypothetical protein [Clostridium tetanomorphum]MBC2399604.1 hypothetical protein [Clostridium tetanomorphum]MBP1866514.1 hypothetical protein [Clostridium tetanomorphum]NRS83870.1 hypothetical protein [Clostridium tetanomorphum]NRZ97093.1 hypothetical protein [Clostridium tetanomorphum]